MKWIDATTPHKKIFANITVAALLMLGISVSDVSHAGPASRPYTPHVEYGETEIELHGGVYNGGDSSTDGERQWKIGVGHGMTTWWFSEIETEWEKDPHAGTKYEGFEWVNVFQLSEAGEYWVDLGWFTELKFPDTHDDANAVEMGPMFEKEIGNTVTNLNLIFVRDFGKQADHDTEFEYTAQVKWRGNKHLEYGLQALGETGEVEDSESGGDQEHKIGPALFGELPGGEHGKFKYNTALLVGLTDDTPDETLRFTIEYEM